MEIITKYNIGDKVYFMEDNKVVCDNITIIIITITSPLSVDKVKYYFTERNNPIDYERMRFQNQLFTNKEDLLKTL